MIFRPHNQKGQALVEYGIIVALVALAALMGLSLLGGSTQNIFQLASDSIRPIEESQLPPTRPAVVVTESPWGQRQLPTYSVPGAETTIGLPHALEIEEVGN